MLSVLLFISAAAVAALMILRLDELFISAAAVEETGRLGVEKPSQRTAASAAWEGGCVSLKG